ncbi:DUF72 domain-containing protein [Sphingomonas sp. GC_Shp_1]|uniref:DUF72 domain-containing protein n=1 Tax=Sphingomonas sp. GC_Shp_1 TaxID=2937385 RepID=UPI00226B49C3|nr:DUF72 domain-containing protein [Sphingomonas sp. GC_Shp_1]
MAGDFPGAGSHLERYAAVFDAVEINSSFHRPHRPATYARWAASVPAGFRFALKLPKTITHERRLVDTGELLARFADGIAPLGDKRGPLVVQLPPSLGFDRAVVDDFFAQAGATLGGALVCEPRHGSWFGAEADQCLVAHRVARVAADPARVPEAAATGGWPGLAYRRLHGSPRIYYSGYDETAIAGHAAAVGAERAEGIDSWTIYDNTAAGHATADAMALITRLGALS